MSDTSKQQLTRDEITRLSRENPAALVDALHAGQLRDVLASKDRCPTCGQAVADSQ